MLGSIVREVIAPVLRECPPECGIVTITEVQVSKDFRNATVFVSALKEPELALKFLRGQTKRLHTMLGEIRREVLPQLTFKIDHSAEEGERIERLLKESE